ncbi:hypothetical protein [Streptomyces sp. NPDC001415]
MTELMAAAIEDVESALHASCVALRVAGARLLPRARAAGAAQADGGFNAACAVRKLIDAARSGSGAPLRPAGTLSG